jgi:hypothetical protein
VYRIRGKIREAPKPYPNGKFDSQVSNCINFRTRKLFTAQVKLFKFSTNVNPNIWTTYTKVNFKK